MSINLPVCTMLSKCRTTHLGGGCVHLRAWHYIDNRTRLNSSLIANQTTVSPDLPTGHSKKFLVFKYSAGTLGRTVYISVVTLIMQGLCDAISKRGKVQLNHLGRIPLPPCASMHACCWFLWAQNEGKDTCSSGQPSFEWVDTLTMNCHIFNLCSKATKEGEKRKETKGRQKLRALCLTCL